jgi:hypothetical protein
MILQVIQLDKLVVVVLWHAVNFLRSCVCVCVCVVRLACTVV